MCLSISVIIIKSKTVSLINYLDTSGNAGGDGGVLRILSSNPHVPLLGAGATPSRRHIKLYNSVF